MDLIGLVNSILIERRLRVPLVHVCGVGIQVCTGFEKRVIKRKVQMVGLEERAHEHGWHTTRELTEGKLLERLPWRAEYNGSSKALLYPE